MFAKVGLGLALLVLVACQTTAPEEPATVPAAADSLFTACAPNDGAFSVRAFDGERLARLPRTFIDCTEPAYPTIAAMRERVRSLPGFRVAEMKTGHCPMVSAPQDLVGHLLVAAG